MLLTVDIGNTNITLGAYKDDDLQFIARLTSEQTKTEDQYAIDLVDILNLKGCSADDFNGAIISSVVPGITESFKSAVEQVLKLSPLVVGPGIKTGLNIKIDNPAQLGADLVVGAVAVINRYPLPAIIYDLGTATTISVIDKLGNFLGGIIAPGVGISLKALTENTAALPVVGLKTPKSVIGSNTEECMRSGLILGSAAMLDGLTDRILDKLAANDATLIATGGRAAEIIKNCRYEIKYSDNLLMEGLLDIYKKNI